MIITYDCWYHIFKLLDGDIVSQLKIKLLCKELNTLPIIDLFNIHNKYKCKLTDKILLQFQFVKYFDASGFSSKITDKGIKHLTNLNTLDASENKKITDEGIKHLTNLHTLDASGNCGITDKGIKHLTNLHILYASGNEKITDEGIKYLTNLHTLYSFFNEKITCEGTEHLTNLHIWL